MMKGAKNGRTTSWVLLLTIVYTVNGLQHLLTPRRQFVSTISTLVGALNVPESSLSQGTPEKVYDSLSSKLLSMIPITKSGAPVTNATLSEEMTSTIETFVSYMEESTPTRNNIESPLLSGSWRLVYSNAPEIVGLAKGLPLGFFLGPTYQPLDTAQGFFENTARVDHPYKLATLRTIAVGNIQGSPKGSINEAGVINDKNNRVTVNFEVIAFELDTLLGRPLQTPIRKTLVPKPIKEGTALPANDQTYLDERVRIVRGGDGSLFVFSRETSGDFAPLTEKERADFLESTSSQSTLLVGQDWDREQGKTSKEIPAEIKYLYR